MSENDRKRELIIESAMKRFSRFGVQKTTMNEIADDMAVTQPSLYYYFPDKTSLIVAVVEKVLKDYFSDLELQVKGLTSLREFFYRVIEARRAFLERYFMLHLTDTPTDAVIRESCASVLSASREKEVSIVANFIKESASKGEISTADPQKTSSLYLDSITGLSMWVISRSEKKIFPESEQFELVVARQQELAEIFLRGLKYDENQTGSNRGL
ncbi:TetR family transcriptional regulator [Arcticibacter tournemirensis]|uniref:TetR/AcrR family transcriptional regulator n=1 Tax=Arcticibacter tournemirensis TaxID=699437 RepID=A0A5M9H8F7_9SPHI|nr:TetR/AcrR family transcriptional regulator [Arcticibacter tournemirensis]KAA8482609.1 TetR/AcrR family transcriptional regulator [Arcticibacter tournemirensis]TQM52584.1 TetR family transcriptional regulator [Arcticibacter tournemirensis]